MSMLSVSWQRFPLNLSEKVKKVQEVSSFTLGPNCLMLTSASMLLTTPGQTITGQEKIVPARWLLPFTDNLHIF